MKTFVSKIYLPKKESLIEYIDRIYESGWLTNNGPLVQELEERLQEYLGVKNLLTVGNGTIGLQIAIKTLGLTGNILTTPFTYVATSSAIVAERLQPRYVDIDAKTLNLDPQQIESRLDSDTSAIMPVHVFGNACDIETIDRIAQEHGLPVIYDAAHAFGVDYKDRSIYGYGDISVVSFHATKFFHTIEGGAIIVKDDALYEKAKAIRAYGAEADGELTYAGVNGKMHEFEAAMGLCNLEEIDLIRADRRAAFEYYRRELDGLVQLQEYNPSATVNYSYFAALFRSHDEMKRVRAALNEKDIFPRQYFYPSLDTVAYTNSSDRMPVSQDVADRILVLPLHSGAEKEVCRTICEMISK